MALDRKNNICTICQKKGDTNWHQIITNSPSQNNQKELFSNPNNKIELCNSCHNKTVESTSKMQGGRFTGLNQPAEGKPAKQKSREARVVAKQKSRDGRVLAKKRNLERKDKQERITSRKKGTP